MAGALTDFSVAKTFFKNIVRFFGVPAKVISDRDPRFTGSGKRVGLCWGPSF